MQPSMLLKLLRKLTVDVSKLSEYTTVALRVRIPLVDLLSVFFFHFSVSIFYCTFQLLTLHYERCAKYYGSSGGQGMYGASSDEEKRLTMMLFSNIFDSLSQMVNIFLRVALKVSVHDLYFDDLFQDYEPELFGKALPCLSAIGCALPPDYSLSRNNDDEFYGSKINVQMEPSEGPYNPQPINTVK